MIKDSYYIFLLCLFLVACSNQTDEDDLYIMKAKLMEAPVVSTELKFIGHWLNEGKRENLVKEIANEFEFLNQDYSVKLEFPDNIYYDWARPESEAEFISKQLLSEKSEFDIIRINDQYLKIALLMKDKDWPRKYLVDFSQYPEFMENTLPELTNEKAKSNWSGIIPGPYLEGYNYALWYNQLLAKEMGLEIKQFGMTFNDLLQYIQIIDNYNKRKNTKIIPIHECNDWNTINVLALSLFMSEVDDLDECLRDNFSNKKYNAYMKTIKAFENLAKYNAYAKNWKDYSFKNSLDFPLKQKCFFYVNASWMFNIWQSIDNIEVNNMIPAEIAVFKPTDTYFGGYNLTWAVPKNAPNKEHAVEFLLFMTKPDIAEKWSRYTKCPTGIKGNVTSVSFGKDQFEDFTFEIDKKYGMKKIAIHNYDNTLVTGISKKAIKLRIIEVATGLMSADEAMTDILSQLKNYQK